MVTFLWVNSSVKILFDSTFIHTHTYRLTHEYTNNFKLISRWYVNVPMSLGTTDLLGGLNMNQFDRNRFSLVKNLSR